MQKSIRPLALALLKRNDGKFLLERGEDTLKNEVFYRPLGGGIEFGETGEEALIREFQEEIGKDIVIENYLTMAENIFEYNGDKGHQIILIYNCRFKNKTEYDQEHIKRIDVKNSVTDWKSLTDIQDEGAILHPWQIIEFCK